jgi:hypothetical protein
MKQLTEKPAEPSTEYLYNIVVGVYGKKENAEKNLQDVKKLYPDAFIKKTVRK